MSKIPATNHKPEQDSQPPDEQQASQQNVQAPSVDHSSADVLASLTPEEEMREARQQLKEAQKQMELAQKRLQDANDKMESTFAANNSNYLASSTAEEEEPKNEAPEAAVDAHEPSHDSQPEAAQAEGHYGLLNGIFNGFAKIAPFAFLLVLACMAWPMFMEPAKGVFCPAEVKTLSAFIHSIATASWLAPSGLDNGAFTAAQWPVFSWVVALFALIPGLVDSGLLLPVATFSCTFLAVFGVWVFGLAAGFGNKAAFAGGLILLCAPLFAPLPHFVGPAALAAGLLLLALSFLCIGWRSHSSWISLPIGFLLTACAGLCGGLLHFATPLIASLLFLIWQGKLRRAQRLDALFGFILMLAVLGVWLGMIMMNENHGEYLHNLLAGAIQYPLPALSKWLLPIIAGLLGLVPWLLVILGVSWFRVLGHAGQSLSESRHENGSAMVWIALAGALALSIIVPAFHPAAIVISCLAALLLGKAFIHLASAGSRFFFLLASLFLLCAGVFLNALTYPETQQLIISYLPIQPPVGDLPSLLIGLKGLQVMGYICILGGLIGFFFVKRFRGAGGLVFGALVVIALCQPARLMFVPEMAAHAGTPLASYANVEKMVLDAMAPKAKPAEAAGTPAPAPAETEALTTEKPAEQPAANAAEQPAANSPSQEAAPGSETAPNPAPPADSSQSEPATPAEPEAGDAPAQKSDEVIIIEESAAPTEPAEAKKD